MSRTLDGVEELRKIVDDARGSETYASIAFKLGESEQWLSNKLRGVRKFDVDEVVRLADVLDRDPVQLVNARWPELGRRDRLSNLRRMLNDAGADEVALVEEAAQGILDQLHASPRRGATGRRRR